MSRKKEITTRVNLKIMNVMVVEFIFSQMEVNTLVNGCMIKEKDSEDLIGKMALGMTENGKMIREKDGERSLKKAVGTRDNGPTISVMAGVLFFGPTEIALKDSGKTANSRVSEK